MAQYPTNTLYTSDELTITCVTTVNQAVDVPVQVTHQWVGPGGVVSTSSHVNVSDVTSSGHEYSSTLSFHLTLALTLAPLLLML